MSLSCVPGSKANLAKNEPLALGTRYVIWSLSLKQQRNIIATGLDPTQDTPVEILHTVLLGIVKYVWYNLHSNWKESQRDLFVVRLQLTELDGLTIPPIRATYMMQYHNGLIGKHFKSLMQTMVFHVHGLVSPEQFSLIKAIGALGAMLWIPEIEKMDDYLVSLFHVDRIYEVTELIMYYRLTWRSWWPMCWMHLVQLILQR